MCIIVCRLCSGGTGTMYCHVAVLLPPQALRCKAAATTVARIYHREPGATRYYITLFGAVPGGLEVSGGNAHLSVHEVRYCTVCHASSE